MQTRIISTIIANSHYTVCLNCTSFYIANFRDYISEQTSIFTNWHKNHIQITSRKRFGILFLSHTSVLLDLQIFRKNYSHCEESCLFLEKTFTIRGVVSERSRAPRNSSLFSQRLHNYGGMLRVRPIAVQIIGANEVAHTR